MHRPRNYRNMSPLNANLNNTASSSYTGVNNSRIVYASPNPYNISNSSSVMRVSAAPVPAHYVSANQPNYHPTQCTLCSNSSSNLK